MDRDILRKICRAEKRMLIYIYGSFLAKVYVGLRDLDYQMSVKSFFGFSCSYFRFWVGNDFEFSVERKCSFNSLTGSQYEILRNGNFII